MFPVFGLMSAQIIWPPIALIAVFVAEQVIGVEITKSPSVPPAKYTANCKALVQEFVVIGFTPKKAARCCSNSSTFEPWLIYPDFKVLETSITASSDINTRKSGITIISSPQLNDLLLPD